MQMIIIRFFIYIQFSDKLLLNVHEKKKINQNEKKNDCQFDNTENTKDLYRLNQSLKYIWIKYQRLKYSIKCQRRHRRRCRHQQSLQIESNFGIETNVPKLDRLPQMEMGFFLQQRKN